MRTCRCTHLEGYYKEKDLVPGFSMGGTLISSQAGGGLMPASLLTEGVEAAVFEALPVGVRVKVTTDPCGRSAAVVT